MKTHPVLRLVVAAARFVCAAWLVGVATPSAAEIHAPDLAGLVKSADGQVLTNASVFIYTAGPRVGVGYI